jgi:hypothetical protein
MYRMRRCSNHEEKVLRMKHLLAISLRSLGSINKRLFVFDLVLTTPPTAVRVRRERSPHTDRGTEATFSRNVVKSCQSPSDGENCWPHSAAGRLRGRSRRVRSRRRCR